jgi:formylglycine-generating enzyme required for sulfatase activity
MVAVPSGTFIMGSSESEEQWEILMELVGTQSESPQHEVTVSGFRIGKYEVTQKEWQDVMGTSLGRIASAEGGNLFGIGASYPMYFVSWYDALVFCNKLSIREGLTPAYLLNGKTDPAEWGNVPREGASSGNNAVWNGVTWDRSANGYRLPTGAEWEYACRAGTTTATSNTGDTITKDTGVNTNSVDPQGTRSVGSKAANPWGLYDMHGNVWEWCWDWYADYSAEAQTDPTGPSSGTERELRGASWRQDEIYMRSAVRRHNDPAIRRDAVGFRVVRSEVSM